MLALVQFARWVSIRKEPRFRNRQAIDRGTQLEVESWFKHYRDHMSSGREIAPITLGRPEDVMQITSKEFK